MNTKNPDQDKIVQDTWYDVLMHGYSNSEFRYRRLYAHLPANPRCRFCYAPFKGIGARVVRLLQDKRPSNLNPNLCNVCEKFASEYQGGAEVELTMLFADVRSSTAMAESMDTLQYSRIINRFYNALTNVLIQTDALINRLVGDQVIGLYVPGFAGPAHSQRAIEAAHEIMQTTGHPDHIWIPLGIGIHTGRAFVGAVGSKNGTTDIAVLGDAANTTARLSSTATDGEILVSEAAWGMAALNSSQAERRTLTVKGKKEPLVVFSIKNYA